MPLIGPFQSGLLEYQYAYDESNNKGSLFYRGKKISDILVMPLKNDSQLDSDSVGHPYFLTCLVVDRTERKLLCVVPKDLVMDYLTKLLRKTDTPFGILDYTIPRPSIPNKFTPHKVTSYLPSLYRTFIRHLYKFVIDQHILGFSLTDFDVNDLWMDENVLKNVELKVTGVGFIEANAVTRKQDFDRVLMVIKKLFGRNVERCPPALIDLVKQTEEFDFASDAEEENILANHLAIIPPSETLKFIIACEDGLHDIKVDPTILDPQAKVDHQAKVDSNINVLLRVKKFDNWVSKFKNKGEYGYVSRCFNHQNVATYQQFGDQCAVKYSMLRFARNMALHLRKRDELKFEDIQLEAIIMELFHEQLLSVHSSLHEEKRLQGFMKMI